MLKTYYKLSQLSLESKNMCSVLKASCKRSILWISVERTNLRHLRWVSEERYILWIPYKRVNLLISYWFYWLRWVYNCGWLVLVILSTLLLSLKRFGVTVEIYCLVSILSFGVRGPWPVVSLFSLVSSRVPCQSI